MVRTAKPRPRSAGCLVVTTIDGSPCVLLVHPSGAYNRRSPWSIPKGLPDEGEDEASAAVRETLEETGIACEITAPLGRIDYARSRKTVVAFLARPLVVPASRVLVPASWEVDRVEFVTLDRARDLLHPDQEPFLDRAIEGLSPPARA